MPPLADPSPDPTVPRPPLLGIAGWLLFVALLAFLPMSAFSGYMMWKELASQQAQARASLDRRAAVAAAAVAQELEAVEAALLGIAQASSLRRGELREWHEVARRVVQADPRLKSLSLTDERGRMLLHTDEAFGTALPISSAAELQALLVAAGRPRVSPLLLGARSGQPAVGLAMALDPPGEAPLVLRGEVDLARIGLRLNEQAWPADWIAGVIDQRGVIVARSREPERFVGQPATAALRDGVAAGLPTFVADTREGTAVVAAAAPIGDTGWHVVVGQPLAELESQAREPMRAILAGGLVSAVIGLGAAGFAARHLRRQLAAAVEREVAGSASPARLPVREFDQLAGRLHEVREEASRQAMALRTAQLDALTGVAGLALFLRQAETLHRDAQADPERTLAVAYVDLDGFKQVNDRFGHETGDRVLRATADVLRSCVRESDPIGRLGGDEFAVCMGAPRATVDEVGALAAARMVSAIGAIGEGIGCSVGLAVLREGESFDALLDRADRAMLTAKRAGRNRLHRAD